ncbi:MAG: amidohydrolase [Anaerolineaceae bacterium]|nr:MAG: amidohydrolase [Anaerolineaceae bacterium]
MLKIDSEEMLFIDAHCHVWNDLKGQRFGGTPMTAIGSGRVMVGEKKIQFMSAAFADSMSPIEVLEVEMENLGIDKGVLLETPCYGPQYEYVGEIIRKSPDKYVTTGLAYPTNGKERFIEEADEAIKQTNCKAIKFEMPDTPFVLDDPDNAYIFEYLLSHDMYCMIDMGWHDGEYDYPIKALENVVKRYQDLTFILPHMGVSRLWDPKEYENFENLKRTIGLLDLNENIWFDTAGLPMLSGRFEEYPYPKANSAFKLMYDMIGVHHVMFGTDYPGSTAFCTYKQSVDQFVKHCDFLTLEDKKKFFGLNADELWFGIKH